MTNKYALTTLALAFTLLAASSATALDRATVHIAQAGPEDGEPREAPPAAREKNGGERPARRERDDGDGAPPARKQAPSGDDAPPRKERPAKADDGDAPRSKKQDSDGDDAPPRKPRADRDDEAPRSRNQDKPEPKAEPEAPEPKPKTEPKDTGEPKAEKQEKRERKERRDDPTPPDATPPPDSKAPEQKTPEPKAPEPDTKAPEPSTPDSKSSAPDRKTPDSAAPPASPPADKGAAAAPSPAPGSPAAPTEAKDLKELKQERKERREEGGRVVIEEPDKRVIVKEGGKTIIRHDETERFRRLPGSNVRREKRNGLDIAITIRPGGIEIYTEHDDRGRPLRRYRRDRDGREVILFDNRDYYRRHRDGSFIDAVIDLPPPRVAIPRERYIVDYEEASDVEVYEALSAPPVEELDRTYSLEEVRRSPTLRDRMRRIDLDSINFAFGSWDVANDQYPALQRVANAMKRVIDRNPDEMFMVEGHTDAVGSDEDNLSLSDRRAESVSIILTEEFGVPPENMTTQGYGEQYLKVETQEAERQNRRVAVRRITPLLSRK